VSRKGRDNKRKVSITGGEFRRGEKKGSERRERKTKEKKLRIEEVRSQQLFLEEDPENLSERRVWQGRVLNSSFRKLDRTMGTGYKRGP